MDNYEDFYCGECRFFAELYDKRRNEIKEWCNLHNNRVEYENSGCPAFALEEGDEK